jgi:nucleoredoxin
MRRIVFALVFACAVRAEQLPLTVKEISLMLRTGYSSDSVTRELAARHFADTLDEAKISALAKAGASPELIATLKSGTYSLSPEAIARAQAEIADQSKRRQKEAEASRKFDTLYQDQLARQAAAAQTVPGSTSGNAICQLVKGDLVHLQNGAMTRFDDSVLENKKLIAFYFSAHWCGPCRKFTPQLVDYYNRVVPQHPEFELIFVSLDKSQFGMETYIRESNMPWPAIDYQKLADVAAIRRYGGDAIPCLVLVDATGKVISQSFAGKEYLGPQKVLSDLDTIFDGKAIAAAH